jgi:hypothetical protein
LQHLNTCDVQEAYDRYRVGLRICYDEARTRQDGALRMPNWVNFSARKTNGKRFKRLVSQQAL